MSNYRIEKSRTAGAWEVIRKADNEVVITVPTRSKAREAVTAYEEAAQVVTTAEAVIEEANEALDRIEAEDTRHQNLLYEIAICAQIGQVTQRNEAIRQASALRIRRADIASAAGLSINYLQHILKPQAPRARKVTQYAQGYQAALAEIADLAISGKTRDEALLHIEEWLENAGVKRDWIGA